MSESGESQKTFTGHKKGRVSETDDTACMQHNRILMLICFISSASVVKTSNLTYLLLLQICDCNDISN
jgi:hypothetical protein